MAVSCSVGRRYVSDPTSLWLRHKLAAVTLIRPLALELPYAMGVALKSKKKKGENNEQLGHTHTQKKTEMEKIWKLFPI